MKPGSQAVLATNVTTPHGLLYEGTKVVVRDFNAHVASVLYQRPTFVMGGLPGQPCPHGWHPLYVRKSDLNHQP